MITTAEKCGAPASERTEYLKSANMPLRSDFDGSGGETVGRHSRRSREYVRAAVSIRYREENERYDVTVGIWSAAGSRRAGRSSSPHPTIRNWLVHEAA